MKYCRYVSNAMLVLGIISGLSLGLAGVWLSVPPLRKCYVSSGEGLVLLTSTVSLVVHRKRHFQTSEPRSACKICFRTARSRRFTPFEDGVRYRPPRPSHFTLCFRFANQFPVSSPLWSSGFSSCRCGWHGRSRIPLTTLQQAIMHPPPG